MFYIAVFFLLEIIIKIKMCKLVFITSLHFVDKAYLSTCILFNHNGNKNFQKQIDDHKIYVKKFIFGKN